MQHAMLMPHITLSSVACPAEQYFSTLSYERHDLIKKNLENKVFVLILSTSFV
jgi:hypothetical protein